MMYGKVIKASCYSHIRLFSPGLRYVDLTPIYGDDYIIEDASLSKAKYTNRFKHSVLMSAVDYDIDLTNRNLVIKMLNAVRPVCRNALENFRLLDDELAFWNAIKAYHLCGWYKHDIIKHRESFYPVFFNLGGDRSILLQEMARLQHVPVELLFSILMGFLEKVHNVHDTPGLKWRYKRDLLDVGARITDTKRKVYRYLKSQRDMNDFLGLILSL